MFTRCLQIVFWFLFMMVFLSGCGSSSKYMRSEPSTHFPTKQTMKLPDDIKEYLNLHCTKSEEIKYEDSDSSNSECMYISVDASAATGASLDNQKVVKIVNYLTSVSDLNCSTFLHRAFANKAGMDYTKNLLQDLATGVSAGLVTVSAPASAALDGVNLIVGKSIDNFNTTFYFDKTFQAMEAAIESERAQKRAYIFARKSDTTYTFVEALADIRAYDDACSIKKGLSHLINIAENNKQQVDTKKAKVEMSTDKLQAYKDNFLNLR